MDGNLARRRAYNAMTQPPGTSTVPAAAITPKACVCTRRPQRAHSVPMGQTTTCWPPAAGGAAVKAEAIIIICVLLLLLLPAAVAQAPADAAAAIDAEGDGNGTTRGGGDRRGGGGGSGGGGGARSKLVSSIDCQICEATCRVKCLINNLFQWGVCYQRCKSDNCNDWCR
ncbi:unnamed protein product [Urochloa decumbens]|uniref:Uncharacterized protein n=1 Tax=Urochloa decumbens TaxID=240449 RepID=A0ABC8YCN3_9POAL